ncbi:uncharacterized protein LOC143919008 [Arctopsyche grandis]|uniref:uncharacterized protein LOC143919008 n=1 Tax=Arctopsyche grandis TaxID=121162 RepID=UPI00406DA47C
MSTNEDSNNQHNLSTDNKVIKKKKKNKEESNGDGVDTSNFTIEERLVAAVWVHERKLERISMSQIKVNFRIRFSKPPPTKNTLYFWEKKIFATGKVADVKRSGRPCKRKSLIPFVEASLKQAPGLSIRSRAQQLSLPTTTLRKILTEDIKFQPAENQSKSNEVETVVNVDACNQTMKPIKEHMPKCNIEQPPTNLSCANLPPPHSYSYAETFGSLPLSAFQHFLAYPNNGHQGPQMMTTHSKMSVDNQNHHVNINVGSHMHTHQQHAHPIIQHNYIPNNQLQDATILTYTPNGEHNIDEKSQSTNISFVTTNFLK